MLQVLTLGLRIPGQVTTSLEIAFDCLRRHEFVVGDRLKWISQRTQIMKMTRILSEAPKSEDGLITFEMKHADAKSAGGTVQWYGPRRRTKERPFDSFGFTTKTTSSECMGRLPAILAELGELLGAVYGDLSPWNPGHERQLHSKPQQTLLYGLPALLPVTYLRRDLFDYVGEDRWRSAGVEITPRERGVLLVVPDWPHATSSVLDGLQEKIGPRFFFHGSDWKDYPLSPLANLERELPSGRSLNGRNN
jgi:hypothetical protein